MLSHQNPPLSPDTTGENDAKAKAWFAHLRRLNFLLLLDGVVVGRGNFRWRQDACGRVRKQDNKT